MEEPELETNEEVHVLQNPVIVLYVFQYVISDVLFEPVEVHPSQLLVYLIPATTESVT